MNLARISELNNLLSSLYELLKKLKERKSNLEREVYNANNVPERMDYAVNMAKNRVSELSSLGLRAEFLEDIFYPVQNKPDCGGLGITVRDEISGVESEIQGINNRIWVVDQEKIQLEMEGV